MRVEQEEAKYSSLAAPGVHLKSHSKIHTACSFLPKHPANKLYPTNYDADIIGIQQSKAKY
jgi:hypothetical protein